MTHETRLDVLARGWRGRLFAALVALIAGLPGLIALPALDREEARFAQSTAQMLETGDFIDVKAQDQPRPREPLAPHWLQAASVRALSSVEARQIWAYRIPSLLGAMVAAAACAWGAAGFFGSGIGAVAGGVLGGCLILSTEAAIGKTDAMLCGAVTLALAALGRLYAAETAAPGEAPITGVGTRAVFWLGLALAILAKGLTGPIVVGLTGLALWAWDRRAPWARSLGWGWGLILIAAVVGPWLTAVTVGTDAGVWTAGPAPDLAGLGPRGRAPPGLHLLAAPLLLFPFAALLPPALVGAWRARAEPGARFALCWLVPNWLLLEIEPVRLIHHALPLYGALAWLAALALTQPIGRWTRVAGAVLSVLSGLMIAGVAAYLAHRFGGRSSAAPAVIAALLAVCAGVAGALILVQRRQIVALAGASVLGVAAHGVISAGLAPGLAPLWLSRSVMALLDRSNLDPRAGLAPGPVTVAGYAEPSLVFALGTETELGDIDDAAQAIAEGRPVVIEHGLTPAFQQALAVAALKASPVGAVSGLDYVNGRAAELDVYRSDSSPPSTPANDEKNP